MNTGTPEQVIERFSTLLARSDLDALVDLYEPDAVFAPQPGQTVTGRAAIRAALTGFLELRPEMDGEIQEVLVSEDTALVSNRWSLRGTAPDGAAVEMGGMSSDVMRRGPDGAWRIVIDNPWGHVHR
jgi:uncharacterized protein (TIGR02246 family)